MGPILSVLNPRKIVAANVTSTTATEPSAWVATTNYAVGDRVSRAATSTIFENVLAGVNATVPEDAPERWRELGANNALAMFDDKISTSTRSASPLVVVLTPGAFNSIFMAGIDAESMTISLKDTPGGTVIDTREVTLEASAPDDYYEYFFDPFIPQTDYLGTGFTPYGSGELTITVRRPSGFVEVGMVALGDMAPLGRTLSGAKAAPKTNSIITVDEYGETVIKKRRRAKDMSASATVSISEANVVLDRINQLLDVLCVWSCTDTPQYSGLRCFGLGSAELSYNTNTTALLTLNVKGAI